MVLSHNTDDYFELDEVDALSRSTHNGGGVVGVDAASSGMKESRECREILGATFVEHPEPQWGRVKVEDSGHYITKSLSPSDISQATQPRFSSSWPPCLSWFDEWYNFRSVLEDHTVLLSVDDSTFSGR